VAPIPRGFLLTLRAARADLTATLLCRIITAGGRTMDQSVKLKIKAK
jgi:hypothetical protein